MSSFSGYEFSKLGAEVLPDQQLPGGATVCGRFGTEQLSQYQEADFSIHPADAVPDTQGDFEKILRVAKNRFPHFRLDVSVRREPFTAGKPDSFSTHALGVHHDGFKYGFFVLSTDEATVFCSDEKGSMSEQAKPGYLIFVPPGCYHSAPNPTHDGERVRIKIIPQDPL